MLIDKALDYRQTVQALTEAMATAAPTLSDQAIERLAATLGRSGYALIRTTEDSPVKAQAVDWFGRKEDT